MPICGVLRLAGSPHYKVQNGMVARQTYVHYNNADVKAVELKMFLLIDYKFLKIKTIQIMMTLLRAYSTKGLYIYSFNNPA